LDGSSVLIVRPYDKNQLVKDKLAPEWGDFQTLPPPPFNPPPFTRDDRIPSLSSSSGERSETGGPSGAEGDLHGFKT
jgi:hypothetical protein